ncbi:PrsW family glutamic-type intramembrane protease [Lapidilactobacillus wuchangensis]|uniref:PrsW family glutamic-type intramembrane protease n=1 Tax=Lapidilactobacillus wuchangensis TaxID=2486001 RepID=UPI000F7952B3|nr:PrsW family intramembrane metalloprotease [Lapidilactobacillus wuchangensis]
MKFCPNCGAELKPTAKFCTTCGYHLPVVEAAAQPAATTQQKIVAQPEMAPQSNPQNVTRGLYASATEKLNQFTGEQGPVKINLKDLFSQVFQKHTQDEAEEIFIAGTKTTTPALESISSDWAKPWLFSRILAVFGIAFVALLYMAGNLGNEKAIPGLIFVGAFAVPLSAVIFFFESNVFQNVSLYQVAKVFFIGGVFSLLITMILYSFVTMSVQEQIFGVMTLGDALSVGVVEEVGKLVILLYFVSKLNIHRILNGILIGGAVGAGFAAFETAGYIYQASKAQLVDVAIVRAVTAIGGHLVWCAIAGGALIIVKKANRFDYNQLLNPKFLVFFVLAVAMHALWDYDLPVLPLYLKLLLLTVAAWLILFVLINAGLKEVTHIKNGEIPA